VYTVKRVQIPSSLECLINARKRRDKEEHAFRTLNPNKIAALKTVLSEESIEQNRIVVFSDSAEAAPYLVGAVDGVNSRTCVGIMDGKTKQETRDCIVERFRETPRSVVVSTRVCDVAVDFPKDCVVVIVHSSSGSRQQEVQRCGRGTRGDVVSARVFHIVNVDTEEERFVERRILHMRELYGDGFSLQEWVTPAVLHSEDCDPLQRFIASKGEEVEVEGKPQKARQITKRSHMLKQSAKQSAWKRKTLNRGALDCEPSCERNAEIPGTERVEGG
jgi:superfamily II DNA or RNA helicase